MQRDQFDYTKMAGGAPGARPDAAFGLPPGMQPSFWHRNRRWLLPVLGCSGAMVAVGAVLLFVAAIAFGVMSLIRNSDIYQAALKEAQDHPRVQAALGVPIEAGWFVTGNIHSSGSSEEAKLEIPLRGPNGSGALFVEGKKRAGQIEFSELLLQLKSPKTQINLLRE